MSTMLASLSSMLKRSDIEGVARNLGESEQAVSRGMDLSATSILSALSRKAGDSELMRQVTDLASKTPANALASAVSGGQYTSPSSPLMAAGERLPLLAVWRQPGDYSQLDQSRNRLAGGCDLDRDGFGSAVGVELHWLAGPRRGNDRDGTLGVLATGKREPEVNVACKL